ncbi:hypothetical protein D3C78_1415850 [compost metagenome]
MSNGTASAIRVENLPTPWVASYSAWVSPTPYCHAMTTLHRHKVAKPAKNASIAKRRSCRVNKP